MDPEDLRLLVGSQEATRSMAEAAEGLAQIASSNGEKGLAFAAHMLRESLLAYDKAVTDYAKKKAP